MTKWFEAESHQPLTTKEKQHANVSCIPNDVIEELESRLLQCKERLGRDLWKVKDEEF